MREILSFANLQVTTKLSRNFDTSKIMILHRAIGIYGVPNGTRHPKPHIFGVSPGVKQLGIDIDSSGELFGSGNFGFRSPSFVRNGWIFLNVKSKIATFFESLDLVGRRYLYFRFYFMQLQ